MLVKQKWNTTKREINVKQSNEMKEKELQSNKTNWENKNKKTY